MRQSDQSGSRQEQLNGLFHEINTPVLSLLNQLPSTSCDLLHSAGCLGDNVAHALSLSSIRGQVWHVLENTSVRVLSPIVP